MSASVGVQAPRRNDNARGTDLRYPGPKPFEDKPEDRDTFFGRAKEARLLTDRIEGTRLLIVYGRSGMGKTSLLNAGVFPLLCAHTFFPVTIRLNHPDEELTESVITRVLISAGSNDLRWSAGDRRSLWIFLKTTVFWRGDVRVTPVLVFDQFEEVFTALSPDQRAQVARVLGELVGPGIPWSVRAMADIGEDLRLSDSPPALRVVISLREDYVGTLQSLFSDIPSILNDRFRLEPLTREQAASAIVGPASIENKRFALAPYAYKTETLEMVLDYLQQGGMIEAFQLQVVCSYIENERLRLGLAASDIVVDANVVRDALMLRRIEESFYLDALRRAYPHGAFWRRRKWRAARRLCEFGLLGAKGSRQSLSEEQIAVGYGLSRGEIDRLVEVRVLRIESRLGAAAFELTHDSLAKAIRNVRSRRVSTRYPSWGNVSVALLLAALAYQTIQSLRALSDENRACAEHREALGIEKLQGREGADAEIEYKAIVFDQASKRVEFEGQLLRIETRLRQLKSHADPNVVDDLVAAANSLRNLRRLSIEPDMYRVGKGRFFIEPELREEDLNPRLYVSVEPMTFSQYRVFERATGRALPTVDVLDRGLGPARKLGLARVDEYTKWLSLVTGLHYRSLTEADLEPLTHRGGDDDGAPACENRKVPTIVSNPAVRQGDKRELMRDGHRPFYEKKPFGVEHCDPEATGFWIAREPVRYR